MSFCRPPSLRRALLVSAAASAPLIAMPTSSTPDAEASTSTVAPTVSPFDQTLLRDVNDARATRGLRRLALVAGTTDVAHHWSCHMAGYHVLAHNPNLRRALERHGSINWTTYGENIASQASAYGANHLFRRYMRDPAHRANILNRSFRYVGVWSKRSSGRRWNTTDFVGATVGSYLYSYGGTRVAC
jgi:uncharacterized protein YkwD